MTELKNFQDLQLEALKVALEDELSAFKNSNKNSLNNFLLDQIQDAEKQIAESKKKYTDKYDLKMAELEKKRKADSDNENDIWKFEEKYIKENFERRMRITIKLWTEFIKDCKSTIK